MNGPRPTANFDNDGLQADVMRFMAIIAFCLVAVFALVREGDGPTDNERARETERVPLNTVASLAELEPTTHEPIPAESHPAETLPPEPEPVPLAPAEEVARVIPPTPRPSVRPAVRAPRPPAVATRPVPDSEPAPDPVPKPTPAAQPEPSLSLSFASDRDFMKLLGTGTIELFVVTRAEPPATLRFDPQRQFVDANAEPGSPLQIYELMPTTIPDPIAGALNRSRPGLDSATWGVRLPAPLERAIAEHRAQHSTGTLLIDRYARIRHVPAA